MQDVEVDVPLKPPVDPNETFDDVGSIMDKDHYPVNVKDSPYRAKGDGVTNDSTAIQAAITAAAGNEVYFPAGTYILGAGLTSCRKICGDGAGTTIIKLKASTAATMMSYTGVTDGYLRDVTVDGNRSNGATGAMIFASSSTRMIVQDCHLKSGSDKAINWTNTPVSCRIEGCRVTDFAGSPVISAGAGTVVERCTVDANVGVTQISVGADSKVFGCSVSVTGASSIVGIVASAGNVIIQNNTVDLGTSAGPSVVGIRTRFDGNYTKVIGNRINANGGTGIALGIDGTTSLITTSAHTCVVANNVIQAAGGDGIIAGWDQVAGGSTGYNCVISGNSVFNVMNGDGITQLDGGIECHLPYSVVVGNTVDTTGGHGIYSSGVGTQIVNNTVRKAAQRFGPLTATGSTSGIKAANDTHFIVGNRITDPGLNSTNVAWGIEVEAGVYFASIGGYNITSAEVSQNMILETRAGASRGLDYGIKTGIRAASGATFTGARQFQNRIINPVTGEFNATAAVMTVGKTVPSVTSAATITLPESTSDVFNITGTTNITAITTTGQAGRTVTLKFAGALTFTAGATLKLAGAANMVTTADDTWTGFCDGTNWYEITRSANA